MMSTFIDLALVLSTPGLQRFSEFGDGFGVHTVVFDSETEVEPRLDLRQAEMGALGIVRLVETPTIK